MPQIIMEDLHKTFRVPVRQEGFLNAVKSVIRREHHTVRALQEISFTLDEGELVGYIGPNGAGKSTTVKIMSGILVPDSGRCEILGNTPWKQRVKHVRNIGVVFGQRSQLWWDVPVIESFDLLRDIYRVPQSDYTRMRDELTAVLSLGPLLEVPVRQLSLGQRMRCELAASLLHRPPVLFLDEPTIGLDAVSKIAVRDFIRRINRERNVTVILTTHDMDDIEALCSRVMVIGRGKLLFDGDIHRLRNTVTPERIMKIDFTSPPRRLDFPCTSLAFFDDCHVEFRFNPTESPVTDLIGMISRENGIRDFVVENPPIEEIVAKMYGGFAL